MLYSSNKDEEIEKKIEMEQNAFIVVNKSSCDNERTDFFDYGIETEESYRVKCENLAETLMF